MNLAWEAGAAVRRRRYSRMSRKVPVLFTRWVSSHSCVEIWGDRSPLPGLVENENAGGGDDHVDGVPSASAASKQVTMAVSSVTSRAWPLCPSPGRASATVRAPCLVHVRCNDLKTVCGKPRGDRTADSTCGAGDERGKRHHIPPYVGAQDWIHYRNLSSRKAVEMPIMDKF